MQDHPFIPFQWHVNNNNTLDNLSQNNTLLGEAIEQYNATKGGILANNAIAHQLAFLRFPPTSPAIKAFGDPTSGPRMPHYGFAFCVSVSCINIDLEVD